MKEYTYFSRQKIPTSKKTKSWFKDCIDAIETSTLIGDEKEIELKDGMRRWENLNNNIIDSSKIERLFNPMQIKGSFPADIENYSLTIPKVNLLVGEEIKTTFEWSVISKNSDAVSNYSRKLKEDFIKLAIQYAQSEIKDEKKLENRIREITKYYSYEYKDLNEVTASRILQYLWDEQDLQKKFSEGFKNALETSREIYRIDSWGNKPVVTRCNPINVFMINKGESSNIEDADGILEITYEPVGKVIDEFYDFLTPKQIDELEEGYENVNKKERGILNYNSGFPLLYSSEDLGGGVMDIRDLSNDIYFAGLPYDTSGNVRVVRTRWLSRKKIGILVSFDENGNETERYVSERYKPIEELGEYIRKWMWVNEACEGTKIAGDIYVKTRIMPVQLRHFDNPSMCFLGYVGTDYKESIVERMESYQYMYDIYMRRLQLVLARYKGPITEMDMSKKPDGWDFEQWMYYADILGYVIVDSFKEGKKGNSTGKLAGNFNTTGKVLNPDIGNYIQQLVMMLNYIETQVGKIAGVTDQREGRISNRETVGGIERSVNQSSHITERWFFVHKQTKKRVLQALLDTAKQLYSHSKAVNLSFILGDMSKVFLKFNGEDFASSEYDIFVSDSFDSKKLRNMVEQLSQAAVQNGAPMSLPIDVLRSSSISAMIKKLETNEQERMQREQDMNEMKLKSQENIAKQAMEEKEKDRELEYYRINKEYEASIISKGDASIEEKKINSKEKIKSEDNNIKEKALQETKRHNINTENISRHKEQVKK